MRRSRRGLGMREAPRRIPHPVERIAIGREGLYRFEEFCTGTVTVQQELGCAGALERFRVAQLVIVGGEGKRYQHRRLSRSRDFRHRTRA